MSKTKKHNQGFSLIELLIAVTILSIVMIMVVSFMGTSSAAYRKNEKNLNVQTEAMKVMEQMSDTLMQAKYVRIVTKDQGMYTITKTDASNNNVRTIAVAPSYTTVNFDFVPDNYGNYAEEQSLTANGRKVIVNFDDYTICSETKSGGSIQTYPLSGDDDFSAGSVRSFRALKPANDYLYIKPEYIYAEYVNSSGNIVHVIFHITDITDTKDNTCSIYMTRYETLPTASNMGYTYARTRVLDLISKSRPGSKDAVDATKFTSDNESAAVLLKIDTSPAGLLTDKIQDFYLSADTEGNALLTNIMFSDMGYQYNVVETINFRNSDVLTVRPQKLFKVKGTGTVSGGAGGAGGSSTENSSETNSSSEATSESSTTETP